MKLTIFGGKGGVGKTTCAAASAIDSALGGSKTLLLSADPAHSLSDCLGQTIGNRITLISGVDTLHAIEIDADKTLKAFKEKFGNNLKEILQTGTYLDETDVEDLASLSIPGLDEVIALIKMVEFVEQGEFESYVLDTAPTGHALRLLRLPQILDEWIILLAKLRLKYLAFVSQLSRRDLSNATDDFMVNIKRSIKKLIALLRDPARCNFIVVTVPEKMVIEETKRLVDELKKLKIPVGQMIINRVLTAENSNCPSCQQKSAEHQRLVLEIQQAFREMKIHEIPDLGLSVPGMEFLRQLPCPNSRTAENRRQPIVVSEAVRECQESTPVDYLLSEDSE